MEVPSGLILLSKEEKDRKEEKMEIRRRTGKRRRSRKREKSPKPARERRMKLVFNCCLG